MFKPFLLFFLLNYRVICNTILGVKDSTIEQEIEGKVVAITGGAVDIGFALADNFLCNGAKVAILLDIKDTEGKQAQLKLNSKYGKHKAYFIKCDVVTDLERVSKTIIEKYKYVDIFINNAASVEENKPRKLMLINAVATIEWSLIFFDQMRVDKAHGKGGTVINIASIAGHGIDPLYSTYKASKFAMSGFSQSLGHRLNYEKYGVRVLTLCPGPTNTTLVNNVYSLYDKRLIEKVQKYYNFSTIQSSNNVGKCSVELFKTAESGTSWDIVDELPAFESPKEIDVMP